MIVNKKVDVLFVFVDVSGYGMIEMWINWLLFVMMMGMDFVLYCFDVLYF